MRPRQPGTRSSGDVARALGCSRQYVSRLIAQGRIRATRTAGGQYRVTRYEFERLLREGVRDSSAQSTSVSVAPRADRSPPA